MKEHPFTQDLFQLPSEKLRALIARDRDSERVHRREIANVETKRRLARLAKVASQFMKQQLDDVADLTPGEGVDPSAFMERGLMVVPTYARLAVGSEKKLWLYVGTTLPVQENAEVSVHASSDAIEVLDPVISLSRHPKRDDRLYGVFRIRADKISDGILLQATVPSLPPAEAMIEVVESTIEFRDFRDSLEFEHSSYTVREGSSRTIRLLALFPDLVSEATSARMWTADGDGVMVKGSANLVPIANSNFARAEVSVRGRRLNSTSTIMASANGRQASARVRVIQKEKAGVPLDFDIRDEDFSNFRAIWADHEGHPNLLLISARHASVSRYLGPGPEFPGQDSPLFRLLLAEIVAESVCRKVMQLDTRQHPWDYRLADLKDDFLIFDTVVARLHGRIRDFIADAHAVMLDDADLKRALDSPLPIT